MPETDETQRGEPDTANLLLQYSPSEELRAARNPLKLPLYFGEAAVDIVAVQGLATTFERTWFDRDTNHNWLADFLCKDFPDARVLAFQYHSEWYDDPEHINLADCGERLLRCLVRDRCHVGQPGMCPSRRKRPLILIGHSMGGLVIKQALVLAYQTSPTHPDFANHQNFLNSISAAMFLGTPHKGSSLTKWAKLRMSLGMLQLKESHPDLITLLAPNSSQLQDLQLRFSNAISAPQLAGVQVYCYKETKSAKWFGFTPGLIVKEDSAWLVGAVCRAFEDTDHRRMNKFSSPEDNNYIVVRDDIEKACELTFGNVLQRFANDTYNKPDSGVDLLKLKDWLSPVTTPLTQELSIRLSQHSAAPYTCHWIEDILEWSRWIYHKNANNALWLSGPAGCGKSVMAAVAKEKLQDAMLSAKQRPPTCNLPLSSKDCSLDLRPPSVLYYFCGVFRGETGAIEVLGTLLHQLLSIHCEDRNFLALAKEIAGTNQYPDEQALLLMLKNLAVTMDKIFIVIDGLEEHPACQSILEYLGRLRGDSHLRLLLCTQNSGKMSEQIHANFTRDIPRIFMEKHVNDDIRHFIEETAKKLSGQHDLNAAQTAKIVQHVEDGADGVFQWVNSVLVGLGTIPSAVFGLENFLTDFPPGMHSMYEKILKRAAEQFPSEKRLIRKILMWLTVAARPMQVNELKHALISDRELLASLNTWTTENTTNGTDENITSSLEMLLGPLIKIGSHSDPDSSTAHYQTVQLCHNSLRSLLLTSELRGSAEETNILHGFSWSGQEANKYCASICLANCHQTLSKAASQYHQVRKPNFVDYAWENVFYHFRNANGLEIHGSFEIELDRMVSSICHESLLLLHALSECFFVGLMGTATSMETQLGTKLAQHALLPAVTSIRDLKKSQSWVEKLREANRSCMTHWRRLQIETNTVISIDDIKMRPRIPQSDKKYSRVTEVRLESLFYYGSPFSSTLPVQLSPFVESVKALRLMSLRISSDPVHRAVETALGNNEFNPVLALLIAAHAIESCASLSVETRTALPTDAFEHLDCTHSDPFYGPAIFVIAACELRAGKISSKPDIERRRFLDSVHKNYIHELHTLPKEQTMAIQLGLSLFVPQDLLSVVRNPLANYWLRRSALMPLRDGDWLAHPSQTMGRAVADQGMTYHDVFWFSPELLFVYGIFYVRCLVDFLGGPWTWFQFSMLANRLETSWSNFCMICWKLRDAAQLNSHGLLHWSMGLLLYGLRCLFFPWFGARWRRHPWEDLWLAWNEPVKLLAIYTGWSGWTFWMRQLLAEPGAGLLHDYVQTFGMPDDISVTFLVRSEEIFWAICYLERQICRLVEYSCYPIVLTSILFGQPDVIKHIARFTLLYLMRIMVSIFYADGQNKAQHRYQRTIDRLRRQQNDPGRYRQRLRYHRDELSQARNGLLGSQIGGSLFLAIYFYYEESLHARLIRWLKSLLPFILMFFAPLRWVAGAITHQLLHLLEAIAIILVAVLIIRAASAVNNFVSDPYQERVAVESMFAAAKISNELLGPGPRPLPSLGEAPFGTADATQGAGNQQRLGALEPPRQGPRPVVRRRVGYHIAELDFAQRQ